MSDKEKRIEFAYSRAFSQSGAILEVFPAAAKVEMANMVEAIARADANIAYPFGTNHHLSGRR